ncbi:MAG TPA: T9SS type A sorting domain-containing protein [Chitinophagales bacterium]|nr:T9SS type A sorting domain-containing protein [Chitinophagales bacterium]
MKHIFIKSAIAITTVFIFSTSSLFSQNWTQLGNGVPGFVQASCMMGDSLVVAYSNSPYNYNAHDTIHIAIWNGTFFSELPILVTPTLYDSSVVNSMIIYNGELYVAGSFDTVNGIVNSTDIIKWNGTQWETVGGGAGSDSYLGTILLEVFNNELYAFGDFIDMGGSGANYLARWNGSTWNTVPFSIANVWSVYDMKAWNNSLFLTGYFSSINGVTAQGIAQWDGTTWSSVDGSMGVQQSGSTLGIYNNQLCVGGSFNQIGGVSCPYGIASWDGSSWHDASNGVNSSSNYLTSFTEYNNELWASGYFYPSIGSRYLMHWDGNVWSYEDHGDPQWNQLEHSSQSLYGTGSYYNAYGFHEPGLWCDNGNCGIVSGNIYSDDNLNCIHENNEASLAGAIVSVGNNFTTTNNDGDYSIYVSPGSYNVTHTPLLYWTPECPASNTIAANVVIGVPVLNTNFGDTINTHIQDISAYIASMTGWVARVDSDVVYQLTCSNIGTMMMSGSLELHLDPNVVYLSSNPIPVSINANVYTWDFTNLNPGATETIEFIVHIPGNLVLHSYLYDTLIVNPINGDLQPSNNTYDFSQIVGNAWDPNDKQVSPAGVGSDGEISLSDSVLTYHIDFQNTGNAIAHNVTLMDTLSDAVDPLTIQFLTSSHPYSYSMKSPGIVEFDFLHIELPDSNSNEPGSHGFVEYSIHLMHNLPFGTQIKNSASIYFDFNQPVKTNEVLNTLVEAVGIPSLIPDGSITIFPNPAYDYFNIRNGEGYLQSVQVENALGQIVTAFNIPAGSTKLIDTKLWAEGIYFVRSSSSGNEKIMIQR